MKLSFKSMDDVLTNGQREDGRSIADLSMRTDTAFCQALVATGMLTEAQMQRAAGRYRLGRSRDGGVVFWEIDEAQRIRDGKIMYYHDDCHRIKDRSVSWVSARLKQQGDLPQLFEPQRCLFGQHLLVEGGRRKVEGEYPQPFTQTVAVVEAEKTAVICSELFPQFIWTASGGKDMLNVAKLYPLRDRKVVLFPDTDPDGRTYEDWRQKAEAAQPEFCYPIRVSRILEDLATDEQKQRKIDIADFIFET